MKLLAYLPLYSLHRAVLSRSFPFALLPDIEIVLRASHLATDPGHSQRFQGGAPYNMGRIIALLGLAANALVGQGTANLEQKTDISAELMAVL